MDRTKSIAVLTSIMLLVGFGASFYTAGTQTVLNQTTSILVVQTSSWTHAITNALTEQLQMAKGAMSSLGGFDARKMIGAGIGITILVVGVVGLFINATKLLVSGDATHTPIITGAGATLLGATLVGLIIAAGIVFLLLRVFNVV